MAVAVRVPPPRMIWLVKPEKPVLVPAPMAKPVALVTETVALVTMNWFITLVPYPPKLTEFNEAVPPLIWNMLVDPEMLLMVRPRLRAPPSVKLPPV